MVLTSLPWRPKGLLLLADISSQASIDKGEASLEDIPTSISPIAAISGSNSTSTSMDLAELWANTNKALNDLMNTNGSIDTRRQRAVWDLGVMLHQNESQVATTVTEARTICSQKALEARTGYLVVVKEAKTTRSHLLQEAEATCSKVICEAKAQKISQATKLHKKHGKYMWDLEEQAVEEESKSHNDFLTACQAILYSSPPLLKSPLATLYHLLLRQTPLSHPLILPQRTSSTKGQPTATISPSPVPKQSPKSKSQHPLPDPMECMPMGGATPKATLGGPPRPKRWEIPHWLTTLKPNHAEEFSWDSNMVRKARREYFSKHSFDFTSDGTCNLSGMFKCLAIRAGLLGTSIIETQSPWTGPEKLKQVNFILLSTPKGLKFLWAVPHQNLLRSWGLCVSMTQMPSTTLVVWPIVPGVGRRVKKKGWWSTTYRPLTTC